MTTRDAVLAALQPYDLKPDGPNKYRCNRPWSPGSDSQSLTIIFDDDEHGAYFDHVTKDKGTLYDLARLLNVEIEKFPAQETKKKTFNGLEEYALAHGATAEAFKAADWRETTYQNRPALVFITKTGKRWRFLDGEYPRFKSEIGYKRCWYGLEQAVELAQAQDSNQAVVLCGGEPSVVAAQAQYIPACAVTSGEATDIPADLVEQFRQAWRGPVILAPDYDDTGRKWARKWLELLKDEYTVKVVDFRGSKGFDLADFVKLYAEDAAADIGNLPDLDLENDPADTWIAFTLEDALKPRPDRVHLVENIFEEKTLIIPYGAPGCLKSFLYMDMAICIASGSLFLEPLLPAPGLGMKTIPAPVVWIDFDMGEDLLHERFAALLRGYNLTPDIPVFYYSMPEPWLVANNRQHVDRLINRILKIGAKAVFVDHLKAVSYEVDENSDKMQLVMSNFRRLVKYTGAGCTIIHHQRKSSGADGRMGDRLRGHGSIEAALDFAFLVERDNLSSDVTVTTTKSRRGMIYPFGATFTFKHDAQGKLHSAKFYGVKADDDSSDFAIDQAIFEVLKTNEMNQSDIVKEVKEQLPKVGVNRVRTRIQRLAAFGNLTTKPGYRNETLYKLP